MYSKKEKQIQYLMVSTLRPGVKVEDHRVRV
jgi:hypothetical protein